LQRLTQLRLSGKSRRSGQYPTKKSSVWPGVSRAKDIALHYAQVVKAKCPALEYIKIGQWSWQIKLKDDQPMSADENDCAVVEFCELDWDEMMAIDIFSVDKFVQGSGLPGPDR
jgi:hypothetical protein